MLPCCGRFGRLSRSIFPFFSLDFAHHRSSPGMNTLSRPAEEKLFHPLDVVVLVRSVAPNRFAGSFPEPLFQAIGETGVLRLRWIAIAQVGNFSRVALESRKDLLGIGSPPWPTSVLLSFSSETYPCVDGGGTCVEVFELGT